MTSPATASHGTSVRARQIGQLAELLQRFRAEERRIAAALHLAQEETERLQRELSHTREAIAGAESEWLGLVAGRAVASPTG